MDLQLHANWRSSSSQRVAIGLRLKQLPFRYVPVDLEAREQESERFRALHPGAQVPVLVADGVAMGQSLAILEWLEERWPGRGQALLPVDAEARWRVRQIAQLIASLLQPFQLPGATRRRLLSHLQLDGDPARAQELCRAFSRDHLEHGLATLEQLLVQAGDGPFSVGEAPSLADCCLVPQLIAAAGLGVDVNRFPRLSRAYDTCQQLEAFRASHPGVQPDAPGRGAEPAPGVPPSGAAAPGGGSAALLLMRAKEPEAATLSFLRERANPPIPQLDWVREQTAERFGPLATKMTALEVCLLLRWLVWQLQPQLLVEVGVFSGSSSLALASGLGEGGRLIAFDPATDTTAIARDAWQRAGLADRIELRHQDAAEGLPALAREPALAGAVDLAYVDGCNLQYARNLEDLLPLMRPGGLIVLDNTLWKGGVADPACVDPQAVHLRQLIERLAGDRLLQSCTLGLGDGLTLVRRRPESDAPPAPGGADRRRRGAPQ